jgi:chitin synthase
LGSDVYNLAMSAIGTDMTYAFLTANMKNQADCLSEIFSIAYVESDSFGCVISQVILYLSLALIGGIVLIRFFLALFFHWILKWKLGDTNGTSSASFYANGKSVGKLERSNSSEFIYSDPKSRKRLSKFTPVLPGEGPLAKKTNRASWHSSKIINRTDDEDLAFIDFNKPHELIESDPMMNNPNLMHTLVMVPCYSEGAGSIRPALESVANTDYPSTHKCIFAIADGIVQGAGNDKSTPEYLIEMMDIDPRFSKEDPALGGMPPAFSYVAIADGKKRKNYARVYAGWYNPKGGQSQSLLEDEQDAGLDRTGTRKTVHYRKKGRVPMIVVVKVGNEDEANEPKPGNRGKRDSQVILMSFLNRAMFNERMTELEFDIFYKLWTITGIHPVRFESVLMMDADTILHRDSLRHLIATMIKDPKVIGLCGETQISNPWSSYYSMMQVFEYFISHHQAKAFESIFGVVTCLPGCFCMYRVSAPKGSHGFVVPILANSDIIEGTLCEMTHF